MKDKQLKKTMYIELLTGIILMIYVLYHIYTCSITASQLSIIPFMVWCVVIVMVGFGFAALYEYCANKKRNLPITRAVIRPLLEGVFISMVIMTICSIINAI